MNEDFSLDNHNENGLFSGRMFLWELVNVNTASVHDCFSVARVKDNAFTWCVKKAYKSRQAVTKIMFSFKINSIISMKRGLKTSVKKLADLKQSEVEFFRWSYNHWRSTPKLQGWLSA